VTGSAYACAALLCWHLGVGGALPKEVQVRDVRAYATGERPVRVLVVENATAVTVRPESAAAVEDLDTGRRLGTVAAGASLAARPSGGRVSLQGGGLRATGRRLILRATSGAAGFVVSPRGGRRATYAGALEFRSSGRGLDVVEHVALEDYLAGVVYAEMPRTFPREAMRAQAIAARTYALCHLGDHAADEADLCGRVHCQAYDGRPARDSGAAEAARATAGQVLTWNGLIVDALYHSACGGETACAWEAFSGKLLPYLTGSDDRMWSPGGAAAYCAYDHDVTWSRAFSRDQTAGLVARNLGTVLGDPALSVGRLESLHLTERASSGRVRWLEIETARGTYRVRGDSIRWLFGRGYAGLDGLPSTAFDLLEEREGAGGVRSYAFEGRGRGHGVGLCQWGARGRALTGQTAGEILAAYYPGATLLDLSR